MKINPTNDNNALKHLLTVVGIAFLAVISLVAIRYAERSRVADAPISPVQSPYARVKLTPEELAEKKSALNDPDAIVRVKLTPEELRKKRELLAR